MYVIMMLLKESLGNGILTNCESVCLQVPMIRRALAQKGFQARELHVSARLAILALCTLPQCSTISRIHATLESWKASRADVEVTNPACGDVLRLSARVQSGRIVEARFLARGCVTSIACGSLLAERHAGRNSRRFGEDHARTDCGSVGRLASRDVSRRAARL